VLLFEAAKPKLFTKNVKKRKGVGQAQRCAIKEYLELNRFPMSFVISNLIERKRDSSGIIWKNCLPMSRWIEIAEISRLRNPFQFQSQTESMQ